MITFLSSTFNPGMIISSALTKSLLNWPSNLREKHSTIVNLDLFSETDRVVYTPYIQDTKHNIKLLLENL